MAVSRNSYNPTEHLILAKPRRHYRTGVRWQHWQLRSLIGSNGQNAVYFPVPAGSDSHHVHVQQLNTTTGEQETVKHLSFVPMCLVARNGWVCAGGEKGAFTAFRVGEAACENDVDERLNLSLDERLPIPLDAPASEDAIFASIARARAEKNMLARNRIFGKHRVNGITLWFPSTLHEPCKGTYDQGVAVLANNDRSVTLVSLREQDALDEIVYPDFMNLAVLSPDGQLLAAISDDPYLYIHRRTVKEFDMVSTATRAANSRAVYEWSPCGKIQLISQSKDDRSDHRGSFAACFSSTGKYLAVGTQYGTISVFHVTALTMPGADPLLTHFNTSRSNVEFGAVRDMAFSPGPNDLLAWTEDRGRVGIADSRTGFDSRQIIYFDQDSDYEHIAVLDRSTIDPRLLEQRSDRVRGSRESSDPAGTSDRSNRPSELLEHLNIPLTAEETVVLEAIQDHRRRQEQWTVNLTRLGLDNPSSSGNGIVSGAGSGTGSGIGSGSAGGAGRRSGTGSGTGSGARVGGEGGSRRAAPSAWPGRDRSASVSRAVDDILGNLGSLRSRELSRTRYLHSLVSAERTTSGEGTTTSAPGSRSTGDNTTATTTTTTNPVPNTITATNNASSGPAPERRRYDFNPALRTAEGIAISRAEISERLARFHRLTSLTNNVSTNSPPPSGWDNAEALYGSPVPTFTWPTQRMPSTTSTASAADDNDDGFYQLLQRASAITNNLLRARANYLMRDWEDSSSRRIFGSLLSSQIRPEPYDTAGLSWSENGDLLFVGSSTGIYEFHVNKRGRRFYPSITLS
ncbi:hypothetical protein QBC42DRAFT_251139 [Cladorrhinum samala]|uniref:DUF2415 domain-containing protein n=1 Tax=Cladorrhinum samala TaxID=585594 RepID=A0AAV9HPH5_9PEZI|nr:hypothetical protein QBC42DRAFT_251139 [Cladorrhinum samala]